MTRVYQVNDFNPEITQGDNIKMYLYKLKLQCQNYLGKVVYSQNNLNFK